MHWSLGSTVGAVKEGVPGFAKGLAAGVVGAVVMPVAGVCVGTVQIGRGIANQPEAIIQQSKGKVWDEETREWMDKPDGAIVTVDFARAASQRVAGMFRRAAGEADYYELLEVCLHTCVDSAVCISRHGISPSLLGY